MDYVISQIHTLSTDNESDLKKLKDFLRHEQDNLKANANQIEQAVQALDPVANTLGIAFLLAASTSAGAPANFSTTFSFISNYLNVSDAEQAKKASLPYITVCKNFASMAIENGAQCMMRSLRPLQRAVEKLRPTPEILTPVHAEFIRVCLKAKAYHLALPLLDQPIYDIGVKSSWLTAEEFLCYFYYGALIRIGVKDFTGAIQLLLVVLTCPSSCLSAIQADAYKKYVLVSLKVNGELPTLPLYTSHIIQRYAKSKSYVLEFAEAFKAGDVPAMKRIAEEKSQQITADRNMGLVKQCISSLQRHKVKTLTKTYLTLSLTEIAQEAQLEGATAAEVEDLLLDMISSGEVDARIDQTNGNVSFEEGAAEDEGPELSRKLDEQMQQILELAERVSRFETEVVSSEAYIRKTVALDGDRSGAVAAALGDYDFMDM